MGTLLLITVFILFRYWLLGFFLLNLAVRWEITRYEWRKDENCTKNIRPTSRMREAIDEGSSQSFHERLHKMGSEDVVEIKR
jgi:hypothetical protein